jgi:hypothetical protein
MVSFQFLPLNPTIFHLKPLNTFNSSKHIISLFLIIFTDCLFFIQSEMTILPPTCSFSRMFLLLPPAASGRMATVAAEASGEQAVSEAAMSGCGADEGGGGCSVQMRHRKAGGMAQAGGCRERERHTRRGHLQLQLGQPEKDKDILVSR